MVNKWTADRDQKLFLLLVEQLAKIDGNALSAAWRTKYNDTGADDYQPTPRAITEHIGALKKSAGNGTGTPRAKSTPKPSAATPKAKATPRKPGGFKTPTSSAKRKRIANFSDDDVDDEDAVMDGEEDSDSERKRLKITPSAPRSTYSRRSKSLAKSYLNDGDEEGADADVEANGDASAVRAPMGVLTGVQDDYFVRTSSDGADETARLGQRVRELGVAATAGGGDGELMPQGKAVSRRVFKQEAREDDSDVSEFTPDF